jgi:hypothetical protein
MGTANYCCTATGEQDPAATARPAPLDHLKGAEHEVLVALGLWNGKEIEIRVASNVPLVCQWSLFLCTLWPM